MCTFFSTATQNHWRLNTTLYFFVFLLYEFVCFVCVSCVCVCVNQIATKEEDPEKKELTLSLCFKNERLRQKKTTVHSSSLVDYRPSNRSSD
jgi:hypothetical protein